MKKWMYNALIVFFSLTFVCSAVYLAYYYITSRQETGRYDDLAQMMQPPPRPTVSVQQPEDPDVTPESVPATTAPEELYTEVTDSKGNTRRILKQFAELYALNSDIIGWMSIPGTDIDYPVMQTPDREDYYLRRNFDEKYATHGCLYARETCDVFTPGDNITIYGHRMRDRSMFAQLDAYLNKGFYQEYPYIYFDTLEQMHTYQVMAVFTTTASVGKGFSYHTFENAETPEEFDSFVATCKKLSKYDTGVTATYGDKLITLSTCDYSLTNGRLVVVAKMVA